MPSLPGRQRVTPHGRLTAGRVGTGGRSLQERIEEYSGISSIKVITIACQSLNLAW